MFAAAASRPPLDRPPPLLPSSFARSLIWVIEGVTETNKWDDRGDIETNERGDAATANMTRLPRPPQRKWIEWDEIQSLFELLTVLLNLTKASGGVERMVTKAAYNGANQTA